MTESKSFNRGNDHPYHISHHCNAANPVDCHCIIFGGVIPDPKRIYLLAGTVELRCLLLHGKAEYYDLKILWSFFPGNLCWYRIKRNYHNHARISNVEKIFQVS